jgi:hypothetical protein
MSEISEIRQEFQRMRKSYAENLPKVDPVLLEDLLLRQLEDPTVEPMYMVQFSTVYPGWYEGRAVHIHVKVRTFEGTQETFEWTSQFYLPDSANEKVHTQAPYSNHGPIDITNKEDGIYTGASTDGLIQSNAGQHLMLNLTGQDQGYVGTFNVILDSVNLRA